MSNLPFYITPNDFKELQEVESKRISSAEGTLRWKTRNLEEKNRWFRKQLWFGALFIGLSLFVVPAALSDLEYFFSAEPSTILISLVVVSIIAITTYLSYALDDEFEYAFSKEGLVYTRKFGEPTWVPMAAKSIGVFGCSASVLLTLIVGPSALIGTGGFILASFFLVNRKPFEPHRYVIPAKDFMCVRYNRKRNVICIYSKLDVCRVSESGKHEGKIHRVLAKTKLYVFPQNSGLFEQSLELLSSKLQLACENTENLDLIFEPKNDPKPYKAFRHQREYYSVEDAVTKRDHPTPPPKKPR